MPPCSGGAATALPRYLPCARATPPWTAPGQGVGVGVGVRGRARVRVRVRFRVRARLRGSRHGARQAHRQPSQPSRLERGRRLPPPHRRRAPYREAWLGVRG
eukprot:scaffold130027_cov30-Phaeocystis_antarctica.AAC.1